MTRGEFDDWWCSGCEQWISNPGHTCVGIDSSATFAGFLRQLGRNTGRGLAVGLLVMFGVDFAVTACDPHAAMSTPTATTPATTTSATPTATVTGSESGGDKTKPGGLTHYADCIDTNGTEFRVIVSADVEYSLREGQPCPGGQHVPTARQQNPELYDQIQSALNAPLPYNGGDPNGPCGSWSAADKADADQMQTTWQQCMATHGGNR